MSTRIEVLTSLRAIVATATSADSLAASVASDPRVLYVEEDRRLERLGDPFDIVDPETGLSYQWAHDSVNAAAALGAVGGGSTFPVAVIDTGVDIGHPELAGRIVGTYSAMDGGADVTDELGHGTFVAGLVAAVDGNGIGGKGVGGATSILAVKASSPGGEFYEAQLANSIVWAVDAGARVINMSLGGSCPSGGVILTALDYAHERNVVLVAAAGNNAEVGNVPNCPAADLTAAQGAWGMGLSVGALRPDGQRASFSTFNDNVSVGAPGASGGDCRFGVFSTLPAGVTLWDDPASCSAVFAPAEGAPSRWAYGEGTSFAAPIVSAVAALALQANPNLSSEQVAEVVKRTARQTIGEGWNQQTGFGVVDAAAAVDLARRFDTGAPDVTLTVVPEPQGLTVNLGALDTARDGEEGSGDLVFRLERSRDGTSFEEWTPERSKGLEKTYRASRAGPRYWFRAWVCDANRNCATKTSKGKRPKLVRPKISLKVIGRPGVRRLAVVKLKRIPGVKGKANLVLQRRDGKRFRTVSRFSLRFGEAKRVRLSEAEGAIVVRALVRKAPDWRSTTSRTIAAR